MIKDANSESNLFPLKHAIINSGIFGGLVDDYLKDETLLLHRAEHGGIDIFNFIDMIKYYQLFVQER